MSPALVGVCPFMAEDWVSNALFGVLVAVWVGYFLLISLRRSRKTQKRHNA